MIRNSIRGININKSQRGDKQLQLKKNRDVNLCTTYCLFFLFNTPSRRFVFIRVSAATYFLPMTVVFVWSPRKTLIILGFIKT